MFGNIGILKEYAEISENERILLESWRRPIVLLKTKKELAPSVNEGYKRIGDCARPAKIPMCGFASLPFAINLYVF
jgi:hydrogenase maturation factor HypF (carbamoyltransferase family)